MSSDLVARAAEVLHKTLVQNVRLGVVDIEADVRLERRLALALDHAGLLADPGAAERIREARAEAWDEGFDVGYADQINRDTGRPMPVNPYRGDGDRG